MSVRPIDESESKDDPSESPRKAIVPPLEIIPTDCKLMGASNVRCSRPVSIVVYDKSSLPVSLRVAPPAKLRLPPVEVMVPALSRSSLESVRSEFLVSISDPAAVMASGSAMVRPPPSPIMSLLPARSTVPKV